MVLCRFFFRSVREGANLLEKCHNLLYLFLNADMIGARRGEGGRYVYFFIGHFSGRRAYNKMLWNRDWKKKKIRWDCIG